MEWSSQAETLAKKHLKFFIQLWYSLQTWNIIIITIDYVKRYADKSIFHDNEEKFDASKKPELKMLFRSKVTAILIKDLFFC